MVTRSASVSRDGWGIATHCAAVSVTGADLVAGWIVNWLVWLGLAVVIVALAAVTGIKPKGTRPIAHSRMMGIGRLALLVIVIILVYIAFRTRSGG